MDGQMLGVTEGQAEFYVEIVVQKIKAHRDFSGEIFIYHQTDTQEQESSFHVKDLKHDTPGSRRQQHKTDP